MPPKSFIKTSFVKRIEFNRIENTVDVEQQKTLISAFPSQSWKTLSLRLSPGRGYSGYFIGG